jgi:DNA-directed RNA polymerase specialized sigma24 family protein
VTTAAKPLPPHGTYARANGSPRYRKPCKCEPCLIARRRQDKKWKVSRALGNPAMVDATPAREHLAELRKTRTWASICTATGIAQSNLFYIANGTRSEVQRATRDAILAVQPGPKAVDTLHIDALGSRRRLQALMTVGHSVRLIARECSIAKDRAHDIALGLQPTVRADVAQRIADAYTRLAFRPAPVNKFTQRTRNLAAARGWHGPLAWDDIDNPDEQPDTEPASETELNRDDLAALRRSEVEHLSRFNLSSHEIARRLDIAESTVNGILRELRAGQRRQRTSPQAA